MQRGLGGSNAFLAVRQEGHPLLGNSFSWMTLKLMNLQFTADGRCSSSRRFKQSITGCAAHL